MNKCSVSEEETTRALHALYQAPLPEGHTANGLSTLSGVVSCDTQRVDQNHRLVIPSSHGKKKLTLKAGSHTPGHLTQPSSSVKKSRQISIKSRSLNDVNHIAPHSSSKSSSQHMNKSTELNMETDYDSKKTVQQCLDSGNYSSLLLFNIDAALDNSYINLLNMQVPLEVSFMSKMAGLQNPRAIEALIKMGVECQKS